MADASPEQQALHVFARVIAEREAFARRVDVLNKHLEQLSSDLVDMGQTWGAFTAADQRRELRQAYRAGYLAGRSAARRGAPATRNPEQRARGQLGRQIRGEA